MFSWYWHEIAPYTRVLITLLSRSRAVGPRLWQQGYSCSVLSMQTHFSSKTTSKPFLTWFLHISTYSMDPHGQVCLPSLAHTSLPWFTHDNISRDLQHFKLFNVPASYWALKLVLLSLLPCSQQFYNFGVHLYLIQAYALVIRFFISIWNILVTLTTKILRAGHDNLTNL